ncbi:MAG: hypothetical protein IKH64_00135 [Prevotella sp.]|nr:hypothetical protein [Prevotella sp.]MBR6944345.1 hypothetical protein [Prevotella sp.]
MNSKLGTTRGISNRRLFDRASIDTKGSNHKQGQLSSLEWENGLSQDHYAWIWNGGKT